MRLKTKLVLSATALTCAIVLVLSTIFVGELLRQRVEQTASSNEVLAHEVALVTRIAIESGIRANPPEDTSQDALEASVVSALRDSDSLSNVMRAIVRYSPTVEDVSVTDNAGMTLVSTDPDALNQHAPERKDLDEVERESIFRQMREVFGRPRVLELTEPLQRNGRPFLLVRVGVRSTFVRASYEPWLRAALLFAILAAAGAVLAAGVLASAALRPIETISRQLEHLAKREAEGPEPEERDGGRDAVVRVSRTIDRLGEQIRSTEAGYTALRANLNQMLDTLRDGLVLFTQDGRAAMVSEAALVILNRPEGETEGKRFEEIFLRRTVLGEAVLDAFATGQPVRERHVLMEDGRELQFSIDRIGGDSSRPMTTLVRLRDIETAVQLEQELEVSRRLAAVGRLTSGVGHEVKNPINAMVVHLELLRSKLAVMDQTQTAGAQRHVDILAGEMQRLDRVVETLADFSRPMELHLAEHDLREVVESVAELTRAELDEDGVRLVIEAPREPLMVRVDAELMRQALLNLVLNGKESMPEGGMMRLVLRRGHGFAAIEVIDRGEGIEEEILPRIFDLYFTTKARGSGIGLAMTYRILQMHGGAMEVRSNPDPSALDHGTTFTVHLPMTTVLVGESRKLTPRAVDTGTRPGERL